MNNKNNSNEIADDFTKFGRLTPIFELGSDRLTDYYFETFENIEKANEMGGKLIKPTGNMMIPKKYLNVHLDRWGNFGLLVLKDGELSFRETIEKPPYMDLVSNAVNGNFTFIGNVFKQT